MLDWFKENVTSVTFTLALGLAALQTLTGFFFDLIFSLLIIGLMTISTKINKL